jgi:hypothetical protein
MGLLNLGANAIVGMFAVMVLSDSLVSTTVLNTSSVALIDTLAADVLT